MSGFKLLLFLLFVTFSSVIASDPRRFQDVEKWMNGGIVVEGRDGGKVFHDMSLRLAEKRTERRDPLNGLKYYKDGWNISNEHYLASAGFTGAPLFVIAVFWLLGFGLCLVSVCFYHCCCPRKRYGYSRKAYVLSLVALILFAAAAVVGCVVLYTGQGKFHNSTTATLDFVVGQANSIVDRLQNVSDILGAAAEIGVDVFVLPPDVQNNIATVDTKIHDSSDKLKQDSDKNSRDIKDVLDNVRLILILVAAVMLLITVGGFLSSVFGSQCSANILVIIGWLLVAATFILCGGFIVLQNVVSDTCVAMDEWVEHPVAYTALDDILPCVDNATAQETLHQSKYITYQLVGMTNQFITNVSNKDFPPISAPFYYNQSGPLVPILCNPFNPDNSDRNCSADDLTFFSAPQEWSKYICQVSPSGLCTTVGRLTPSLFAQITKAANVSCNLNQSTPFLVDLQDCTFVRDTFRSIHKDHCPGLEHYSKLVYIGLALISTSVMLSLVLWIVYARERRHRAYTNLLLEVQGKMHAFPQSRNMHIGEETHCN